MGIYLYCLARAGRVGHLEGAGLDGHHPLEILSFRKIAAVFSRVDLDEFCGPEAPARLQDLAWIGPRAVRHEAVVQQVMRLSPVLPARFGTIFSSPERLQEVLQAHHDTVGDFLDRVAGREEWAVKGLLDRAQAKREVTARSLAQEADRLAALATGRRYFEEQRLRSRAEQELNRRLRELCSETRQVLAEMAQEVSDRRLPRPEAAEDGREVIVNWAFLVDQAEVTAFHASLEAVNARLVPLGLVFKITGPWPPYSFCPTLSMN